MSEITGLIRRVHAQRLLSILREVPSATSSQLVSATGLSRPTVHTVCEELIAAGWLRELPPPTAVGPGRRPRVYAFRSDAGHVVGLDVGEHSARSAVADLGGEMLAEVEIGYPRPGFDPSVHLRLLTDGVDRALASAGVRRDQVLAATVAVPAPVRVDGSLDPHSDFLAELFRLDARTLLGAPPSWDVAVENDANLAAIAERWLGAAVGVPDVIVLLAGERLGAGIVVGGQLVRGATGAAGELGFAVLMRDLDGTHGVAGLAVREGAAAIGRAMARPGSPSPSAGAANSLMARAHGDPARVTAPMVFEAAADGDPVALAARDRAVAAVAQMIGLLQMVLDPSLVVLCGGVAVAPGLAELVTARMPELAELRHRPPRIVVSPLHDHAVVLGALRQALDRVLPGGGASFDATGGTGRPVRP